MAPPKKPAGPIKLGKPSKILLNNIQIYIRRNFKMDMPNFRSLEQSGKDAFIARDTRIYRAQGIIDTYKIYCMIYWSADHGRFYAARVHAECIMQDKQKFDTKICEVKIKDDKII